MPNPIDNLRNYEHKQGSGRSATASGGPLDGQATPRTKAENETNDTKEHYTTSVPKDNLGGLNTGS